jgi:MYXO-CTERM domain-containing protein
MLLLVLPAFAQPFEVTHDSYDHVAAVGDINGDGYADVAATQCTTGTLVLFLGSTNGLVEGNSVGTGGCMVAGVGDLDDDGYSDILVGDATANGGDGAIYLYQGTSLTLWKSWSGTAGEGLGAQVAGVGDVTGDGRPDFAAVSWTAPSASPGLDRVSVWDSAEDSAPSWSWEQQVDPAVYTDSVATKLAHVDVDTDGIDELVMLTAAQSGGWWDRTVVVVSSGVVTQTIPGTGGYSAPLQLVAGITDVGVTILSHDEESSYSYDIGSAWESSAGSDTRAMDLGDPDGDGVATLYQVYGLSCTFGTCTDWLLDVDHGAYPYLEVGNNAVPLMAGDVDGDGTGDLVVLDGGLMEIPAYRDADGDGQEAGESYGLDCEDTDGSVYTGAGDVVGDGVDSDCDGDDGVETVLPSSSPTFLTAAGARALLAEPTGVVSAADLSGLEALATRSSWPLLASDNWYMDPWYYQVDEDRWKMVRSDLTLDGVEAAGTQTERSYEYVEQSGYISDPQIDNQGSSSTTLLQLEGPVGADPAGGTIHRTTAEWHHEVFGPSFSGGWNSGPWDISDGSTETESGVVIRADGSEETYLRSAAQSSVDIMNDWGEETWEDAESVSVEAQDATASVSYQWQTSDLQSSANGLPYQNIHTSADITYTSSTNSCSVSYVETEELTTDPFTYLSVVSYSYVGSASDGTHVLTVENNSSLTVCGRSLWGIFSGDPAVPAKNIAWATLDGTGFLVDLTTWQAANTPDGDGDGWASGYGDCDDAAAAMNPCETEVAADGMDNDCDGIAVGEDQDGDGSLDEDDCAPLDATLSPVTPESCDGIDNNCDGLVDQNPTVAVTYYVDSDSDGHGDPSQPVDLQSCTPPPGYSLSNTDCDDQSASSHPGGVEVCDGADNDCNGTVDEVSTQGYYYYDDQDGDQWGDANHLHLLRVCSAPAGMSATSGDCDDSRSDIHPTASELCDGVDNDCDGTVDQNPASQLRSYADSDRDGYGDAGQIRTSATCSPPEGTTADATDCDDTRGDVHPGAPEQCDGIDTNCDGQVDPEPCGEVQEEPPCGCSHGPATGPAAGVLAMLWLRRRRRAGG